MQENNYLISVKSKQIVENQTLEDNILFPGLYFKKDGITHITYEEYEENNKNSRHNRVITIDPNNIITLSKIGENISKLILEKGQRHLCCHGTEFGNIMLGIYTHESICDLKENGGKIEAVYTIDCNSKLISKNYVSLEITEVKNNVDNSSEGEK